MKRRVIGAAVAVALLAGLVAVVLPHGGRRDGTAYFTRAVGLYKGSDVRVLGVRIGEVRTVTAQGDRVRVDFVYDDKYKVPANAKAVVIAASVVSDRFVQLTPAYTGGPTLVDGAQIALERTAVPVELDRIFSSLNNLNVALGPKGANRDGALSRLLKVGADNLDGEGANINQTVTDFSTALKTLANGKEDIFGTVRNLQIFTDRAGKSDDQVGAFNTDLASVADQLAGERGELALALKNLPIALSEVASFVKENKTNLTTDIKGLADITGTLAKQKDAIGEVPRRRADGAVATSTSPTTPHRAPSTPATTRSRTRTRRRSCASCSRRRVSRRASARRSTRCSAISSSRSPASRASRSSRSSGPDLTLGGILRSGPMMRRVVRRQAKGRLHTTVSLVGILATSVALSGCQGVFDLPLPGGAARGGDVYRVTVEFRDVLDLVPQSAVKVNDVTVGAVDKIALDGWHAQGAAAAARLRQAAGQRHCGAPPDQPARREVRVSLAAARACAAGPAGQRRHDPAVTVRTKPRGRGGARCTVTGAQRRRSCPAQDDQRRADQGHGGSRVRHPGRDPPARHVHRRPGRAEGRHRARTRRARPPQCHPRGPEGRPRHGDRQPRPGPRRCSPISAGRSPRCSPRSQISARSAPG